MNERTKEAIKILSYQVKTMLEDHQNNPWNKYQRGFSFDNLLILAEVEGIDKVREILRTDSINAYHKEIK